MNLMPYAIAWGVLAVVVAVLAIMRKNVASSEDDTIHLTAGEGVLNEQQMVAKKLNAIDRWGKLLTVVLVVSGVALGIIWGIQAFEASSRAGLS